LSLAAHGHPGGLSRSSVLAWLVAWRLVERLQIEFLLGKEKPRQPGQLALGLTILRRGRSARLASVALLVAGIGCWWRVDVGRQCRSSGHRRRRVLFSPHFITSQQAGATR
jgi:hypothetical protein